ncbi:P-loop containing nucleoside triphosphate hydrolase protein [Daedalea quercina L-15889]|uniref:p-loop containing nucleoside triphosphate hydrolase protein n=1 Tax=Daedalea quercina L-15889 TaxID=1314783 RepID=A0A165NKR5_9APHY|nr:P-loop containing nucleoside triphosphate hydrolase protein [Daedalea quercina L-15889]
MPGTVDPARDLFFSVWTVSVPQPGQHVLAQTQEARNQSFFAPPSEIDFVESTLFYPVGVAALSGLVLLVQLAFHVCARKRRAYAKLAQSPAPNGLSIEAGSASAKHVKEHSGTAILAFNAIRAASALALLGMSIYSAVQSLGHSSQDRELVFHLGTCATYLYASVLSVASLLSSPTISVTLVRHVNCVLLVAWAVYAYRDLWPLATFTEEPIDLAEGPLLWARISLLTLSSIVVPLIIPQRYIPFDPQNPWANPPPEQTASIATLLLYTWLDPTVKLASRVGHLTIDMLPPLADYDDAQNLMKRSLSELDPFRVKKKGRHVMWGLLGIFRSDWIVMTFITIFNTATEFISPLSIRYILIYLETGGEGTTVRPWFWIITLLMGPIIDLTSFAIYMFLSARVLTRVEAIITQLVFEHALRMRMKADVSDAPNQSGDTTAAGTPDTASVAESSITAQTAQDNGNASTGRGKQKQTSQADPAPSQGADANKVVGKDEKPQDEGKKGQNVVGKINNLISSDLASIGMGREFLTLCVKLPMEIIFCIWFLYTVLGWSAFVGLASIILTFPVPGVIMSLSSKYQRQKMQQTDARVQTATETMSVIRMIKLFGWEPKVAAQIYEKREEELEFVKKNKLLELVNNNVNHIIPLITMIVTYATFAIIMKRDLTASVVFSSITVFETFTHLLRMAVIHTPQVIRAKVSLDRIHDFLQKTELLDEFSEQPDEIHARIVAQPQEDVIGIRNTSFSWTSSISGSAASTPGSGRRNFTLRIDGDLLFEKGRINLIIGPTGSGKTSLLMALLGEMHYMPAGPDSFSSLPRAGGVAYAAQESWVQNETIRDNILFGAPFDEERYKKVIDQCALKRDLELFAAGDKTEVGEKGITLSGGQKARITLARAIYSKAHTLLLDDVLAALDVHTSRWIVDKCFKGDLVRGRTVLLVTHNISMASPIADFVVALGTDGRITSQGSVANALEHNKKLVAEIAKEEAEIEKAEATVDDQEPELPKQDAGKLVVEEEIAVGHVGWQAMKIYFNGLGQNRQVMFWLTLLGGLVLYEVVSVLQTWFIGYWARQYDEMPASEVKVSYFLGVYGLIMVVSVVCYAAAFYVYTYGSLRASRIIHRELISSILGSTLRWLDKTPTSRIIARCTQDIQEVDDSVARWFGRILELSLEMLMKLGAVVLISPIFLIPGVIIAALGGWIGELYMKAQLAVKRERSNAKAPVLGHFGAAFAGLTSIRAYGAQEAFKKESYVRINRYTRASRVFYCLNCWVEIRISAVGAVFSAALAAYLVYGKSITASNTGFSLTMAVGFSSMIFFWIRIFNELEVSGISLERIKQYLEIEHEPKPTLEGVPPAYWPASGDLRVERLSARYSPDGPRVLHEISFEVKSGERIGIVGRTGSGKSSLTLALLRCIITEGKVYYDGLPTDSINLDALRSSITIIPQMPELLSGTLRQNLDPFQQYDDVVLNDALRSAGLFSLQSDMTEGRITLDTPIASGGTNLSVGQRQILALARAIVRQSKLLILDEATSAIDYATDAVIQASLRQELDKGVTLLTVAHRLQTIMDSDKIMVLDAGRIAEFGKPSELVKNKKGMLRALVDESGDRETLYAMANGATPLLVKTR